MKVRMRFKKTGSMKFIGHLDLMRYFQKVFRKAGLPVAYSQGFNPHQIMSFAAPLGVGLTSEGEYVDVEVTESWTSQQALSRINACLNDEIQILWYGILPDKTKPAMSVVAAADYMILLRDRELLDPEEESYSINDFQNDFRRFYEQDCIEIEKKTKKSVKMVDIRSMIMDYRAGEAEETVEGMPAVLQLRLSTGSNNNLKPSLVLQAFCEFTGRALNLDAFLVHRLDTFYFDEEKGLLSLSAQGRCIS